MSKNTRNRKGLTVAEAGLVFALVLVFCAMAVSLSFAQDKPFVYPAKGQSQEQQSKDRYECDMWAVRQTGFDPSAPATAPQTSPQVSAPAQGAAAGAAVGGTLGAFRRAEERHVQAETQQMQQQQQEAQQQQQQAAAEKERERYNRAWSTCLEGRGYTVK